MAWPAGVKRPSEWLHDVLIGKVAMHNAPQSIQSRATFDIYLGACEILKAPDKATRQRMLSRLPPMIRPHVEAEVLRLWKDRKG
jgi:hypothetical protein